MNQNHLQAFEWLSLPEDQRFSRENVRRVLPPVPTSLALALLPSRLEFEARFPEDIKQDREIALALAQNLPIQIPRPIINIVTEESNVRFSYIAHYFGDDREIMKYFCRYWPSGLQYCSDSLKDDFLLVQQVTIIEGMALQYASARLQQDELLFEAAFCNDGRVLLHVPHGRFHDKICRDHFRLQRAVRKPGAASDLFPWIRARRPDLANDPTFVLNAVQGGLDFCLIPPRLGESLDFCQQAVSINPALYNDLPREHQSDLNLMKTVIEHEDCTDDIVDTMSEYHTRSSVIGLALAQSANEDLLRKHVRSFAELEDVVVLAVSRYPSLVTLWDDPTSLNLDVWKAAMQLGPSFETVLRHIPAQLLLEHPELIVMATERPVSETGHGRQGRLWAGTHPLDDPNVIAGATGARIVTLIPDTLLDFRPIQVAFLKIFKKLPDVLMSHIRDDAELALVRVEHQLSDIEKFNLAFFDDEQFMERALRLDGRILCLASPRTRRNWKLFTIAVAQCPRLGADYPQLVPHWMVYFQHQVDTYERFQQVLLGMHDPKSDLSKLAMGEEGTMEWKRAVAEYLDVPLGTFYRELSKCHEHCVSPPPADAILGQIHRNKCQLLKALVHARRSGQAVSTETLMLVSLDELMQESQNRHDRMMEEFNRRMEETSRRLWAQTEEAMR